MRGDSSPLSQPVAVGRQLLNLLGAVVFTVVNVVRWLLFDSWRKRREEVRRLRPSGERRQPPSRRALQRGPSAWRRACAAAACGALTLLVRTPAAVLHPRVRVF